MKKEQESKKNLSQVERYCSMINKAKDFGDVWEIVKASVKDTLGKYREGMLLFLDDLPLRLGAYHPVGTNNMVLNRALIDIVKAVTKSKLFVNAFVYNLLLHEYMHALGELSEPKVRSLVYLLTKECFGEEHIVTSLAEKSPWALLRGISLSGRIAPKRAMEIVKDFEKSNKKYIV